MESTSIHNYYEKIVMQHILKVTNKPYIDADVEDIACVALNHLPPRYIRHEIDMAFYLSHEDRLTIEMHVEKAVTQAIRHIKLQGRSVK
ncbi:MAG: late competence development ComFB family protein [Gammaproteobacteria bacterium]|nr:late competence development ComFB family protein [Gammaproteobacteria bacterium]